MAKNKKAKLPKKIAGMKIPKELRKAGEAAKDFAQGPVVSEMVSAALLAAAASLTDEKIRARAKKETEALASGATAQASAIGQSVKRVLIDAARSLLDNLETSPAKKAGLRPKPKPRAKASAANSGARGGKSAKKAG